MKQLERIYLLNVLLYIPTIESIKKFIQINKKCQEVSEMVRIYTPNTEQMNNINLVLNSKSYHQISSQCFQQLKRLNVQIKI